MSGYSDNKNQSAIQQLLSIMRTLRDPELGCSWDKVQTFASLKPYIIEEAYEVIDAIEHNDYGAFKSELGDLLFLIVFYSQLATEQNLFDFDDICRDVSKKLQCRHPHIFPSGKKTSSNQTDNWEQIKYNERKQKKQMSLLDDIPISLPALMKANKIQKRCASVGFDWQNIEPVLDKVYEEINEVMEEAHKVPVSQMRLEEELGDLLFSVVNLIRHFGFKSEEVLQKANYKFEQRFRKVEQHIVNSGKEITNVSLQEMENIWQHIKK